MMHTTGLVCDDRLYQLAFGRADLGDRALLTVVLQGRLWLASEGRIDRVEAGHAVFLPRKGTLSARTEPAHAGAPNYQSLVLEWNAQSRPAARMSAVDLPRARELAASIQSAPAPALSIVAELVRFAQRIAPAQELSFSSSASSHEPRAQEVADALDAVLSSLEEQPMATDLERRLGVTGRQVTRMIDAFKARYGYGAANWLETRNRRRLLLAATLLTAQGATVAEVARVVGYHRPETLARAFATAGLPKPSQVRRHVEALGAAWLADASHHPPPGPDIGGHGGAELSRRA